LTEQLAFDLPVKPALGREDFLVSEANANAVATLEATDRWPLAKLILLGGEGSGKTHLAHVWAAETEARILTAETLREFVPSGIATPCAVEDADRIAGDAGAEQALFHLHNILQADRKPLLITSRKAPRDWNLRLPDLASRMRETPVARLDMPDDALLGAVMLKLFTDRQLRVQPNLLPYLLRRIDRSFGAARETVVALDRAALSQNRAVTRQLAATVLDNIRSGDA